LVELEVQKYLQSFPYWPTRREWPHWPRLRVSKEGDNGLSHHGDRYTVNLL